MKYNQKLSEEMMIEEIMENFDFVKCWKTMRHLKWTWGFDGCVPSLFELKNAARARMLGAISYAKENKGDSKSPFFNSSGGLKATVWKNMYNQIISVNLEFILTEWETDGDVGVVDFSTK